jgi:hypothetical protein
MNVRERRVMSLTASLHAHQLPHSPKKLPNYRIICPYNPDARRGHLVTAFYYSYVIAWYVMHERMNVYNAL